MTESTSTVEVPTSTLHNIVVWVKALTVAFVLSLGALVGAGIYAQGSDDRARTEFCHVVQDKFETYTNALIASGSNPDTPRTPAEQAKFDALVATFRADTAITCD